MQRSYIFENGQPKEECEKRKEIEQVILPTKNKPFKKWNKRRKRDPCAAVNVVENVNVVGFIFHTGNHGKQLQIGKFKIIWSYDL